MSNMYNGCTSEATKHLAKRADNYALIHTTQMSRDKDTGVESFILAFNFNGDLWNVEFEDTQKDIAKAYCKHAVGEPVEFIGTLSEHTLFRFLQANMTFADYLTK